MGVGADSTNSTQGIVRELAPDTVREALEVSCQVVYEWRIADDRFSMSGDVADLIPGRGRGVPGATAGATGGRDRLGFGEKIQSWREELILNALGTDPAYSLAYPIVDPHRPGRQIWIEERGMRTFCPSGRVERAVGVLRPVAGPTTRVHGTPQDAPVPGDRLTGLLDRVGLRDLLRRRLADRGVGGLAYVAVGLDGMAIINETYGFSVADEVISAFGTFLAGFMRGQGEAARIAGTKFALVLHQSDRAVMTELIRRLIAQARGLPVTTTEGVISLTISAGCVSPDAADISVDALMAQGEEALEQARSKGEASMALYAPCEERELARRRTARIADQILSGLNDDRLVLAYQPIVSCATGEVVQWECLARLLDADGEIVPAAHFIPVAEDLGLVRRIDDRVLEIALADLMAHPDLRLSVNISGSGTVERNWLESYISAVAVSGVAARRLTVEITEYAQIDDVERSAQFVTRLRDFGCTLAIDDFGAGYTSFRNLQRLDVDMVKIDGAFVRNVAHDRGNQLFTRSLIDLARQIGLTTVAECVDSDADVSVLKDMGADYLQGFHLGRPVLDPPWRAAGTAMAGAA